MLIAVGRAKWLGAFNLLISSTIVILPTTSEVSARPVVEWKSLEAPSTKSLTLTLSKDSPYRTFEGLTLELPNGRELSSPTTVSVLIRCEPIDQTIGLPSEVLNLTANCAAFSIVSTDSIRVGFPYQTDGISEVVNESAVEVLKLEPTLAAFEAIRPIESYSDFENKRTVATVQEGTGRYIAGVLKALERPDRPPESFSEQSLAGSMKANPLTGVPLIERPAQQQTGEARLEYPLEFPGTRADFRPSITLNYASGSGYGQLGDGWHLNIPSITVESRWGVPLYDPDVETETYLFNGEQLVPEAGDNFVGDHEDALHLVSMPHRTNYIRPRKHHDVRFVLRRDDGLWRFIRHGTNPSEYWWEAWQEKPGAAAPRVSYFGRAPGRIVGAMEDLSPYLENAVLRLGPVTANKVPTSIVRWMLAREVDAHQNVIDYEWELDCQAGSQLPFSSTCPGNMNLPASYDIYLKRILYTSNLATEETVLRCREQREAEACKEDWAMYEAHFSWLAPDTKYRRSDARTGGLTVTSRLLDRIDVRGRQLRTARLGGEPLEWGCSTPFLGYQFLYRREFKTDGSDAGGLANGFGRAFIAKIVKQVAGRTSIFTERGLLTANSCTSSGKPEGGWEEYPTRFEYDLQSNRAWATSAGRAEFSRPDVLGLGPRVRDALFAGDSDRGPLSASPLGTVSTTDTAWSFYLGLNFFNNPGKENSLGFKTHASNRTGYRETTLLLDVDSDGLSDLIIRNEDGTYTAHLGRMDAAGAYSLSDARPVDTPDGLLPAFNREPFQNTTGSAFEAHPFGAFLASMSSKTSAIQDTYVIDINGDGRPDVVSNGTPFFNTSSHGTLSFSRRQAGGFIDPSVRTGIPVAFAASALTSIASGIENFESADFPRVDPVRIWRVPFSGDVLVRGEAIYTPSQVPSDLLNVPKEVDQELSQVRFADRRDGLLFTVELNRRNWDRPGVVSRCFQAKIEHTGPFAQAQRVPLTTPTPDSQWPVPVTSCFQEQRPGWPDMPVLPGELDREKGLLVSVEAGDILYFRTHSIDNAQDDSVSFEASVDYIRLADPSL